MVKRVAYSIEVKEKAIEMKKVEKPLKKLRKNGTQVKTWWQWYQNGETLSRKAHL